MTVIGTDDPENGLLLVGFDSDVSIMGPSTITTNLYIQLELLKDVVYIV
jgi:hypothetical protein